MLRLGHPFLLKTKSLGLSCVLLLMSNSELLRIKKKDKRCLIKNKRLQAIVKITFNEAQERLSIHGQSLLSHNLWQISNVLTLFRRLPVLIQA